MADRKTTQLTAATTAARDALVAIVEDPGGTPDDKKIALGNLLASLLDVRFAALGSDVTVNSGNNTYVTGLSLELPAGTWKIDADLTMTRAATTAWYASARLSDGTNHYASAQMYLPSVNPSTTTLTMTTVVVLGSTTTVLLQGTSSAATATTAIKAALPSAGSGNNATQITATRVG